jgi:hypothetical protein
MRVIERGAAKETATFAIFYAPEVDTEHERY